MKSLNQYSPWTRILIVLVILLAVAAIFSPALSVKIVYKLVEVLVILFALIALYDCLMSAKPTNTKLLWALIIIIAPLLGALLWFCWGKQNT